MYLSVIIPAFNEENKLKNTIEEISQYLIKMQKNCEMIIVDDGSSDRTFSVASDFANKTSFKTTVLRNDTNKGKGFSVKEGILASQGEFIAFSDADLSVPIDELEKLLVHAKRGYDIAIGSRNKKESHVRIRQAWYRQMMGKIFNLFVRLFLLQDFSDTQCGFKLFKGDIAREIAHDLKIDGFCFDVEMLYVARKKGCRIKEIGIVWDNSPKSKVKIVSSSLGMFFDLFRIRSLHD